MAKRHLKTLTVPVTWPVKRKGQTFIIRPYPGKSFAMSLPIALIFKDLLKYCKTTKEVNILLRDKEVLVDGKRRKEVKYAVGMMDVLSIPFSNEYYRMLINKSKKLQLIAISKEESDIKICKITGKTVISGGKMQLNLFDSRNILVKDVEAKIGESVVLSLPKGEIKEIFKLEKGNLAYLTGGSHVGEYGTISSVSNDLITIETKEGKFETPKEFVFIIGKSKPAIKMID